MDATGRLAVVIFRYNTAASTFYFNVFYYNTRILLRSSLSRNYLQPLIMFLFVGQVRSQILSNSSEIQYVPEQGSGRFDGTRPF